MVTDEFWLSVTFIIAEAADRRCLMGKVVSHMTMSLDGVHRRPARRGSRVVRLV